MLPNAATALPSRIVLCLLLILCLPTNSFAQILHPGVNTTAAEVLKQADSLFADGKTPNNIEPLDQLAMDAALAMKPLQVLYARHNSRSIMRQTHAHALDRLSQVHIKATLASAQATVKQQNWGPESKAFAASKLLRLLEWQQTHTWVPTEKTRKLLDEVETTLIDWLDLEDVLKDSQKALSFDREPFGQDGQLLDHANNHDHAHGPNNDHTHTGHDNHGQQDPRKINQPITFCTQCGTLPGTASKCPVTNINHKFATETGPVFCDRCGMFPQAEGSKCLQTKAFHKFESHAEDLANDNATQPKRGERQWYTFRPLPFFCDRCGVAPGQATQCLNNFAHDFEHSNERLNTWVCDRCGVHPGQATPTECNNGFSHRFEQID